MHWLEFQERADNSMDRTRGVSGLETQADFGNDGKYSKHVRADCTAPTAS